MNSADLLFPTYTGPRIARYFGEHWSMHLPFAYDLMRELRPSVFVELGVYKGESYFTFCQSVEENDLPTLCYGIDTWQGDVHTGAYDASFGQEVIAYNGRYVGFSELIRATFREAVSRFADESIDLLHIDGSHRYADVKRDFEAWRPKLSKAGLVLFHDVMVREAPYGVWQLWRELAKPEQSFLFPFGHGLGVWSACDPAQHQSAFVRKLFLSNPDETNRIVERYALAAAALDLWEQAPHTREAHTKDSLTYLQAFSPQVGEHYDEAHSTRTAFLVGKWCKLRVDVPGTAQQGNLGLRIDPADCIGVISIASIAIRSLVSSEVLWRANTVAELSKLTVGGTAVTIPHKRVFRVFSFGGDPQILLPAFGGPEFDSPFFVETWIRLETSSQSIAECFANLNSDRRQLKDEKERVDAEFNALRERAQELDVAAERKSREFESAMGQHRAEVSELTSVLETRQNQLDTTAAQRAELSKQLLVLEQGVTRFLEAFHATPQKVKGDSSQVRGLIRSLERDIRRILKRDLRWKVFINLQRLAGGSEPADRSARPRTVAAELKQQLESIHAKLKSTKTSQVDRMAALAELLALGRRTRQVLATFKSHAAPNQSETFLSQGAVSASQVAPLFDANWYAEKNPDVAASGMQPLEHFLRLGAAEGRDPHPLFNTQYYRAQLRKPASPGPTLVEHYLTRGGREGLSPHRLFDAPFYIKNHPDSVANGMTPLAHYLKTGSKRGHWPNPSFDPTFYLARHQDVARAKMEPLTHFALHGQAEGRECVEQKVTFEKYQLDRDIPTQPLVSAPALAPPRAKAIAFYLPQFHPIPENDQWWGEGFTEWKHVRAGRPNFSSHYQPHVPGDLGYYDLRDTEVLQRQVELARTYGIHGFCFYYYWFGGQVLLDLPIRMMLETGKPNFPFCLCWANENWTRRWDGLEEDVLIAQQHSTEDDINFIRNIEPALLAKNYIRVANRPLLLVYRPSLFPSAPETTVRWREDFRRRGHGELYLVMVRSFHDQTPPEAYGFDAAVQFPPHFPVSPVTDAIAEKDDAFVGAVCDYYEVRQRAAEQLACSPGNSGTYPAVMPSWDNTARRQSNAWIYVNSSPEAYCEWLSFAVDHLKSAKLYDERLVFINAWNEWSEGCHLEPDTKYGYAWLNATAFALGHELLPHSLPIHPDPPLFPPISISTLPQKVKLHISALFFHREDLMEPFLRSLVPQMRLAEIDGEIECQLSLVFNYHPSEAARNLVKQIAAEGISGRADSIQVIENGFNVGFGAGHNAVFAHSQSDVFLMVNSDVRVCDPGWLKQLIKVFRDSDSALVGLTQTASRLREDGCGIPIETCANEFDFVDGSVLGVRSSIARRFGLFSPRYDYFYFEDADLCLRYRQIGLGIRLLDVACEHERSSSSRVLPGFAVEGVLNQNRAEFFRKWGGYLRTRQLSNRLAVKFTDYSRLQQSAAFPALFGLLSDYPTAIIDLWGVHEQLTELFKHPQIRLIPAWQELRKSDYLRYHEVGSERASSLRVHAIAHQLDCEADLTAARAHLESLLENEQDQSSSQRQEKVLLHITRRAPLFDGKEPDIETFGLVDDLLLKKHFDVRISTNYGTFETKALAADRPEQLEHVALRSGLEILQQIASADILISSDNWLAQLAQLLERRVFLWLGATSFRSAIVNSESSGFFRDDSLSCLACFHRVGIDHQNSCLRGDTACMRPELVSNFCDSFGAFVANNRSMAKGIFVGTPEQRPHQFIPSAQLSLEQWPRTTAHSILILTPVNPRARPDLIERARSLARKASEGIRHCRIVYDDTGEAPARGLPHPVRQKALADLRQRMVEQHLRDEKWIFWIDADIVDYPPFLIEELIKRAEGGIAAPLVLMEGNVKDPPGNHGFGPGRFYDIAGFVEEKRWARFTPPYFDQNGPVYRLDSVGSCYLVNADLYRNGAAHMIDPASERFLNNEQSWSVDLIARNQRGPATAYTEHYSVCQFAIRHELPVRAFSDLIAYHAMT